MLNDNQTDILIAKFFSGEASPEEAMQLQDWVKASALNETYFNKASKLFEMTIDINYKDSKQYVWQNIRESIEKNTGSTTRKLINWRVVSIAASIVLILTVGLLMKNVFQKEKDQTFYQAGITAQIVSLKDKSEIIIAAGSSITLDQQYATGNRKIKLNGSAYFSVIHDPSQSFIIDMNDLHVKDIGTKFNITTSQTGDTVFIDVTEGEIAVYNDFGSTDNARANERALYIRSQKKLQVFHAKQSNEINPVEETTAASNNAERKTSDTTKKKKENSTALSQIEIYPAPYSVKYPLDSGYMVEKMRALAYKDSIATAKLIDNMLKDGLIKNREHLSFKLTNTEFIINGKLQEDAVFQRYKKKYVPPVKQGDQWSWLHNFEDNPAPQEMKETN